MKAKGFTLIEAITVMTVIVILSVSGAYLMVHLVQASVYIPNKLNMDMLASDALDIMIEGDSRAKGLRFSKSITNIQDNQLIFNNQDNQSIRFRLDTNSGILYRSISGQVEEPIPYYLISGIRVAGINNKLFIYYDSNGIETLNPANVRLINVALISRTGSGSYADWEGESRQLSSIAINRLE